MDYLKVHQLNVMLFMSGICGILIVLTAFSRTLSPRRKRILMLLEAASMLLLMADRYAYIFRGDASELGYYMVRLCNLLVFFLPLYILHVITLYLIDLLKHEGKMTAVPKRFRLCEALYAAGVLLIVVSQYTGLYYTFDAQNTYHRSPGIFISYIVPVAITLLQLSVTVQYRKSLPPIIAHSLILATIVPVIASFIQLYAYGISLTNMALVGMAIVLFVFVLIDLNEAVERARLREIEFYREGEKRERMLFEQTAEALATAIDAKDAYTHGHSSRVALYSRQIARLAGKSDGECDQVYFAGLLHDVGKIGVADGILRKEGRLTDEEFAQIKRHPEYGYQILSRIQQSPTLSVGAHYHHERYDGKGYPDGLTGTDIPEIARIISVADAYDAMTSNRSYRASIPLERVREELVKGVGTQFDPTFAKLMLQLIDRDFDGHMQE